MAPAVSGRPTPPNSTRRLNPNSKFWVGLKLIFSPWITGLAGNSLPESFPTKKSVLNGPRTRESRGISNGSSGDARHIYIGPALSLSIIDPSSSRPHQRLCLPKDKFQVSNLAVTYVSNRVN